MRGVVDGAVAPEREENSGELARQRQDGDAFPASLLELERPTHHGVRALGSPRGPRCLHQRPTYRGGSRLGDAVRRRRSELESSPGVRPKYASTLCALAKRSAVSSAATKRTAVTGPTPGTLIKREQVESLFASFLNSLSPAAICTVSASIISS